MTELLQFAPFIQSGILLAGLFVVVFFANMLSKMHKEAMVEMRRTSESQLKIAEAVAGLTIRLQTVHEDVREMQRFLQMKDNMP